MNLVVASRIRVAFGLALLVGLLLLGFHVPPKLVAFVFAGFGIWIYWLSYRKELRS
jgi:hypothetical protein